jgi:REP element-mobilizing transposase RayT
MSRGVEGREIFLDDLDRRTFLRMLRETKKSHKFHVFAYCLMGNHFHLLIQVADSPLYSGMHHFLTRYSLYFNHRHDRRGHLFQSRYTTPLCRQDSYLGILLRYIHLNPLRSGLVKNPAEWIWSGHRGLIGLIDDDLLDSSVLADLRGESLSELRGAYLSSLTEENQKAPYRDYAEGIGHSAMSETPTLASLASETARDFGLSAAELGAGHRGKRFTQAKLAFIENAHKSGHPLRDIAAALQCSPAAVTLMRRRKS